MGLGAGPRRGWGGAGGSSSNDHSWEVPAAGHSLGCSGGPRAQALTGPLSGPRSASSFYRYVPGRWGGAHRVGLESRWLRLRVRLAEQSKGARARSTYRHMETAAHPAHPLGSPGRHRPLTASPHSSLGISLGHLASASPAWEPSSFYSTPCPGGCWAKGRRNLDPVIVTPSWGVCPRS